MVRLPDPVDLSVFTWIVLSTPAIWSLRVEGVAGAGRYAGSWERSIAGRVLDDIYAKRWLIVLATSELEWCNFSGKDILFVLLPIPEIRSMVLNQDFWVVFVQGRKFALCKLHFLFGNRPLQGVSEVLSIVADDPLYRHAAVCEGDSWCDYLSMACHSSIVWLFWRGLWSHEVPRY